MEVIIQGELILEHETTKMAKFVFSSLREQKNPRVVKSCIQICPTQKNAFFHP